MSRVLITGGAGFIGSRLALALLDRGDEVTVLDSLNEQVHSAEPESSPLYLSIAGRVRFIRGDVGDRAALAGALAGQEIVVHFAAETGTGQSMYQIERYTRTNVGGTALLLDLLANDAHAVRRIVVASSRAVYGEGKYLTPVGVAVYPGHRNASDMAAGNFEVGHPDIAGPLTPVATDEDSLLHPSSVYGITKQVQEQLVMTVCPTLGIEAVAFRYQNVYGPGQSLSNPYTGILSIFSNRIMSGEPINIFEDGRETRDFVHVDDVVRATMLGMASATAANQIFNVGSGIATDVITVARTLVRHLGREVPVTLSGNFRVGDIRHNFACLKRLESRLGYRPRIDFDSGIAGFCAWVASMGAVRSRYAESLAEMRSKGLLK